MKKRTIIGIICMVLAVATTFLVAPVVNNLTSATSTVIRLAKDVKQGASITDADIEEVKVKTNTLPHGVLIKKTDVIGKYATSNLFVGDYFTKAKISGDSNTANDVLSTLNGSKMAVSITIDTLAAGLSAKLQNGDIVSIIVTPKNATESTIPGELKFVKVITTTTAGGIDKDAVVKNDDGSYELPSTITLLVNEKQAKLLAQYEISADMQAALVYRGDKETANKFLDKQEKFFGGKTK